MPFVIGTAEFSVVDQSKLILWAQRSASSQFVPTTDSTVQKYILDQHSWLIGQVVASTTVSAADSGHADSVAKQRIEESLNVLRYGQLIRHWPPNPIPEFGPAATDSRGLTVDCSIYMRINGHGFSSSEACHGSGAVLRYCQFAAGWNELMQLIKIPIHARTEMQLRITNLLAWVGQAALAANNAVKLVSLITALEALLINKSESIGKKTKLSERISKFPKIADASHHIDAELAKGLYRIRSNCVHGGRTTTSENNIRLAAFAVAQCVAGILGNPSLASCATLSELLSKF